MFWCKHDEPGSTRSCLKPSASKEHAHNNTRRHHTNRIYTYYRHLWTVSRMDTLVILVEADKLKLLVDVNGVLAAASSHSPIPSPALQLCSYKICSADTIHSWALSRFWFGIFFWIWNCKTSLYYRHCKVHSSGNPTKLKCNLQTASLSWTMQVGDHGLLSPDTSFAAVTHRFRDALSFGKVYPLIWLRQSGTAHLPGIFISSQKILV